MPVFTSAKRLNVPPIVPTENWWHHFDPCRHLDEWVKSCAKPFKTSTGESPGFALDTIYRPLYDTLAIEEGGGRLLFFQDPDAKSLDPAWTNVPWAGSLVWPKAASGKGIVVQSDKPLPHGLHVRLTIGEEVHHESRYDQPDVMGCHTFDTEPYFIPTVQNFCVELRWNCGPSTKMKQHFRVTLLTYMAMEVQ